MPRLNALGQPVGDPLDVTLPRPRPDRTPMQGTRVTIVPTDVATHAAGLFEAFGQDRGGGNWTYLPYGPFNTETAFRQWMETTCTGDDPLFHTILNGAGAAVGLASYLRIDPANGMIEVGHIHLSPHLQRTAMSTEAMFLMMARVFDDLGYRRYEWKCDALNAPSRAAAERLGFRYEGTFRQATHYKGRNRDTAWFALTDKDWPRAKAEFQRWLNPANFDKNGGQLTPLRILQN
ncbi:N-acetyltransferase [Loktanella sp. IMCC34160]|uniref:GNAT family N-acetyltransferase n=1 Tax=Loktanella sp. IMCC34160 TaxID=2510646 RepID=UPI00101C0422|nr:GNAT family protein [Loktanella sp. IMCC34160]RYG92682.1 N-acetyltransferase [Loktanella sp. IMCC34160]